MTDMTHVYRTLPVIRARRCTRAGRASGERTVSRNQFARI